MTIKVLEHNGFYTAYLRVSKRTDDGELYESMKRIAFPSPPPLKDAWSNWAMSLSHDELEVGIQIYFDKWNFGNGVKGEQEVYELLHDERIARKKKNQVGGDIRVTTSGTLNVAVGGSGGGSGGAGAGGGVYSAAGAGIAAALNFPVIKK